MSVPRATAGPTLAAAIALLAGACTENAGCESCDTLVVAAVGEPSSLLPPLVYETVGRDITDRIFERLADLRPGGSPLDPAAFEPGLARSWERVDSLTWRFDLRTGVTWHDGQPFTAEDVRFSFELFADPEIDALARGTVSGLRVSVVDDSTVDITFSEPYAEQVYDATYHVRMMPSHVWSNRSLGEWSPENEQDLVIGTGPYRLVSWTRPSRVELTAVPGHRTAPAITRLIWSIAPEPDAATNALLAGEASAMEAVPPPRVDEVASDRRLKVIRYPSAVYGFLAFNLDPSRRSALPLRYRAVRRALTMALDRSAIAKASVGPDGESPAGPLGRTSWIVADTIDQLPYDTALAASEMISAGWERSEGGAWSNGPQRLGFDILVPATSRARQVAAEAIQEAWRQFGVTVSITGVDFPVFSERLANGDFDSYVGAWLDEPSLRGLADQWSRSGWDVLNVGHYHNPEFDGLLRMAGLAGDPVQARDHYLQALGVLNQDAPAVFIFSPTNVAAIDAGLGEITLNPYSWLEGVENWGRP